MTAIAMTAPIAADRARRSASRAAWWCMAPALAIMFVMTVAPLMMVLVLSFTNYELGATRLGWVGFDNFARALNDPKVRRAVINTLTFAAIVVPAATAIGLFLALLVNERRRSRRVYEVLLFLPITATMTVMALVWNFLLNDKIGPLGPLFKVLGLDGVRFFASPDWALPSLAFIAIWEHFSFCFIVFLAGLTTIPKDLYEAIALDGASRGWERFRRITLPLIAPTALLVILLVTIRTFQVFETVVVLTQGGPLGRSEVILYRAYTEGFAYFRVGYGSAITVIFVAMVGTIAMIQLAISARRQAR